MDLEKRYKDSEGNECTIMQMVLREPEWAANRIQAGEDAINQLQNTPSNNDCAKCNKEELENIMCDIESAIYANEATRKSILEKSLYSVKGYIETHFA